MATGKKLNTRVFELGEREYGNLTELARAMQISVSELYRVKQGKRYISGKFITGAMRAFPQHKIDDLFMLLQTEARMITDKRQKRTPFVNPS